MFFSFIILFLCSSVLAHEEFHHVEQELPKEGIPEVSNKQVADRVETTTSFDTDQTIQATEKIRENFAGQENDGVMELLQAKQQAQKLFKTEVARLQNVVATLENLGKKSFSNDILKKLQIISTAIEGIRDVSDIYFLESLDITSVNQSDITKKLEKYQQDKAAALDATKDLRKTPEDTLFVNYLASLKDTPYLTISYQDALRRAQEGEQFIKQNLEQNKLLSNDQIMNNIANVQWAIYKKAVVQDPVGFKSGMLQVQDRKGYLFNFINAAKAVYTRAATHYKGLRLNALGLDFGHPILPNGRSTLLFGRLGNGNSFLKWEWHGLNTLSDLIGHVVDYIQTRGKEAEGRKEHAPDYVTDFYQILAKKADITIDKDSLKQQGIAYMYASLPKSFSDEFKNFLTMFGLENSIEVRKGNEIIID